MFFSSIKEINRLLSKGISNMYLKVTLERKSCTQKFNFLKFTKFLIFSKFVCSSVFGELQFRQISLNFQLEWNLQLSEVREENCVWLFYYFYFERNYDVSKSKSTKKSTNFNKNKAIENGKSHTNF